MKIRRFPLAFIGIVFLLLLGLLVYERPEDTHAVPSVLRARTIELVGSGGQVRAQLKVERGGEVVFRLRDANGTIRTKLGASESGSGLLLANEATEPGVHIRASRTNTSLILQRGRHRRVLKP